MKELMRFSDSYEDVFIEDGHFLYACKGAGAWGYGYEVNEYHARDGRDAAAVCEGVGDPDGVAWTRWDMCDADEKYLSGLKHAPADVARAIIVCETRRAVMFEDMDEDERAAYMEYVLDRLEHDAEKLS